MTRDQFDYQKDSEKEQLLTQIDALKAKIMLLEEQYSATEIELEEAEKALQNVEAGSYEEAKADYQYERWKESRH